MLIDRSESAQAGASVPENLGELLELARERVAKCELQDVLAECFPITRHESSTRIMLLDLLANIGELVFGIALFVVAFKDFPIALKVGVAVAFAVSVFYSKVIGRRNQKPTKIDVESYRIGLAAETFGGDEIFEEGNTENGRWASCVTHDEELIGHPERFEYISSLVMRATPPRPEWIPASAALPESLKQLTAQLWQDVLHVPQQIPTEVTEGTPVDLAESMFISANAPHGYIDRAFFPMMDVIDKKGTRHLAILPSKYWWSEEIDPLTEFWGYMGNAYQEFLAAWEEQKKKDQ